MSSSWLPPDDGDDGRYYVIVIVMVRRFAANFLVTLVRNLLWTPLSRLPPLIYFSTGLSICRLMRGFPRIDCTASKNLNF